MASVSFHSTQIGTAFRLFTLSAGSTCSTMISSRSRASSGVRSSLLSRSSLSTSSLKYRTNPRRLSFLYPGGESSFFFGPLVVVPVCARRPGATRAAARTAMRRVMRKVGRVTGGGRGSTTSLQFYRRSQGNAGKGETAAADQGSVGPLTGARARQVPEVGGFQVRHLTATRGET